MAKLNSRTLLDNSKAYDEKIVAYLQALGKQCEVADDLVDKHDKYDIVVWSKKLGTMYIDTKYTTRLETKLLYEIEKHRDSAANFIWYFMLNQQMESVLVKKDALKRLTASYKQYQTRSGGDLLVDFNIADLKQGIDYWKIHKFLKI